MIIHPEKLYDMQERARLLKDMEEDIRAGRVITARYVGWYTNWLAKRIREHDYSREPLWDSVGKKYILPKHDPTR